MKALLDQITRIGKNVTRSSVFIESKRKTLQLAREHDQRRRAIGLAGSGVARSSRESLRTSLPSGGIRSLKLKLEQVVFVMKAGVVVKDVRKLAR